MNSFKWEVEFLSKVEVTDTCWLWKAGMVKGYGKFWDGQKQTLAHRAAYEYLIGPIPNGLELDHLCRIPACVNPKHLEPVEGIVNRNRTKEIAIQCRNGHQYTPENIYRAPDGYRQCRECNRAADRRRKSRPFNG